MKRRKKWGEETKWGGELRSKKKVGEKQLLGGGEQIGEGEKIRRREGGKKRRKEEGKRLRVVLWKIACVSDRKSVYTLKLSSISIKAPICTFEKKNSLDLEKKNTYTDLLFAKSQNKLAVHIMSKH